MQAVGFEPVRARPKALHLDERWPAALRVVEHLATWPSVQPEHRVAPVATVAQGPAETAGMLLVRAVLCAGELKLQRRAPSVLMLACNDRFGADSSVQRMLLVRELVRYMPASPDRKIVLCARHGRTRAELAALAAELCEELAETGGGVATVCAC